MSTPELSFATPADLIAALPHLLGYIPANDIIALMLGPTQHQTEVPLRAAIRCPLSINSQQAEQFPSSCHLTSAQFPAALLVAVCDSHHDSDALSTLRTMRASLDRCGIVVHRILTTYSVTEPSRWLDPDTGASGPTTLYTDSPATALGVVDGRVIASSRDDMQAEFAATEPAPHLDLEAQDITALIGPTALDLHQAITGNHIPTTDLVMRAAVVVTAHTALRDGLLRLCVGHELVAGRTWTRIAAHHRGRTRAELLTMAALAYYCGEDTVRAAMALTHAAAAARADKTALPRLTTIIYAALEAGMPPSRIRSVIPSRDTTPLPGTTLEPPPKPWRHAL